MAPPAAAVRASALPTEASPLKDCTPPKPPVQPGSRLICRRRLQLFEGRRCRLLLLGGIGERRLTEGDTLTVGSLAATPEGPLVHQQRIEHAAGCKGGVLRRR